MPLLELTISSAYSSDIENIAKWRPKNKTDVNFYLEITVCCAETGDFEDFSFRVMTPMGASKAEASSGHIISDRALILMSEYSWKQLNIHLSEILRKCTGWSWVQCVERLRRYFWGEFEDEGIPRSYVVDLPEGSR